MAAIPRLRATIFSGWFIAVWVLCIGLLLYWWKVNPPQSQTSLLVFGLVAAVMVFHDKPSAWHKFVWILILVFFVLLEKRAINKDRVDYDDSQRQIRKTEKDNSDKVINAEKEHFDSVVGQLRVQLDALTRLLASVSIVKKVTGKTYDFLQQASLVNKKAGEVTGTATPSGADLTAVTVELTRNLRDFRSEWRDAIHNEELKRDEILIYHDSWAPKPLTKQEREDTEKSAARDIAALNSRFNHELRVTLERAENLRIALLSQLQRDERTTEDRTQEQSLKESIGRLSYLRDEIGCCESLVTLADYLDTLAMRVKAAQR